MGKEIILLRLVEMMDFIDEEDRGLAQAMKLFRFLDDLLEIFDSRRDGGELHASCASRAGEDPGQRGLAASGGAPKNQGVQFARFDHPSEKLAGPQKMLLADEFIEGFGSHPFREWPNYSPVFRGR